MATNYPVTVSTTAYKFAYDQPIGPDTGTKTRKGKPNGYQLGDGGNPEPLTYPSPHEGGGTWLGDPIHFDRA